MLGVTIDREAKPAGGGVAVEKVMSGSPASAAGLKEGDVIVAVDGQAVGSFGDLRYAVASKKMGQRVEVGVVRGGEKMTIPVTLSPLTHGKEATSNRPPGHPR
jgi:S1-C subfamily serine protease